MTSPQHLGKVHVRKVQPLGVFVWDCKHEQCCAPDEAFRSGASIHWEIAQFQADAHASQWHSRRKPVSRDVQTPPGGTRFEWSDTGMHCIAVPRQRDAQS